MHIFVSSLVYIGTTFLWIKMNIKLLIFFPWMKLITSQEPSPTPQFKSINFLALSFLYVPTLTSIMTAGKTIALTTDLVNKVMSLLFNTLSRFVIAFLPRSKHLLISWLQSPAALILEPPPKKKVCHCFHCFLIDLQ